MNWEAIDWKALERLRAAFLDGTAGHADYWRSESDLASYDATFAQRIGWKWDYVLAELLRRGWTPAPGTLLDWGCGSGIAHRAFLDHFGMATVGELQLWDRSPLAVRFAERRARGKYAGLKVITDASVQGEHRPPRTDAHPGHEPDENPSPGKTPPSPHPMGRGQGEGKSNTTLLISHVLTELPPAQVEALADFAAGATSVIWVEPGTFEASLTLIAVRERLRGKLNVIAPCTHPVPCGILAPGNENHWCHHFAAPPPEVFTDGNWARFGELAGVDLRSLPLSFLVLDRRPAPALPAGAVRFLGRPRIYKPHVVVLGCDATGVAEKRVTKRQLPDAFRALKRGEAGALHVWHCAGDEVAELRPLEPEAAS
ncbi:MAG TPA: small ribosomal subunit Rsm22 family protein [Verrucomicrobiae bacterium]|nr:small ribosomal subunit Rsm22 family protein [Verrucomicrobiae bacterium]